MSSPSEEGGRGEALGLSELYSEPSELDLKKGLTFTLKTDIKKIINIQVYNNICVSNKTNSYSLIWSKKKYRQNHYTSNNSNSNNSYDKNWKLFLAFLTLFVPWVKEDPLSALGFTLCTILTICRDSNPRCCDRSQE